MRGRLNALLALAVGAAVACRADPSATRPPIPPATRAPIEPIADAGHQTLQLRWTQAWNLHWAEQRGAEHASDAGAVILDLYPDGRSRAVDAGKQVSSILDGARYEETSSEWSTTWLGTWKLAKGAMSLELAREKTSCVLTETRRTGTQQALPTVTACSAGLEHLALECEDQPVDALSAMNDTTNPTPTPTWSCHPPGAVTATIGTPFPWVLGKQACLERTGGTRHAGPLRYVFCKP